MKKNWMLGTFVLLAIATVNVGCTKTLDTSGLQTSTSGVGVNSVGTKPGAITNDIVPPTTDGKSSGGNEPGGGGPKS